jgi:hypothetical protein
MSAGSADAEPAIRHNRGGGDDRAGIHFGDRVDELLEERDELPRLGVALAADMDRCLSSMVLLETANDPNRARSLRERADLGPCGRLAVGDRRGRAPAEWQ